MSFPSYFIIQRYKNMYLVLIIDSNAQIANGDALSMEINQDNPSPNLQSFAF
jgi:hypothetical protein